MIYTDGLEGLILGKHQLIGADELVIISGFIGPCPIEQLSTLPINTKVVYGMYPEELIHPLLHDSFRSLHSSQHQILYSSTPVHSKLYLWRSNGRPIYALLGSANFSTRGLTSSDREILTEVQSGNLGTLDSYATNILNNSLTCDSVNFSVNTNNLTPVFAVSTEVCEMTLYDPQTNQVPSKSGLNWGNSNGNTNPGDSYISIRTNYIRQYPNLFPPRQKNRQPVELVWDDGEIMEGLFEASQVVGGVSFPKQLSSFRDKSIIGMYLRRRLGLSPEATVQKVDLDNYGRDYINISLLRNGVYFLDFSVSHSVNP